MGVGKVGWVWDTVTVDRMAQEVRRKYKSWNFCARSLELREGTQVIHSDLFSSRIALQGGQRGGKDFSTEDGSFLGNVSTSSLRRGRHVA